MPVIRLISYGSEAYREMVQLRDELLRKPLGLHFTPEDLGREARELLIGCFDEAAGTEAAPPAVAMEEPPPGPGPLIGCCILSPVDPEQIQLRQMAVAAAHQGRGIGRGLLAFAENIAAERGFRILMMHARKTATGFYERLGYQITGGEFTEVGIPHFEMRKTLSRG